MYHKGLTGGKIGRHGRWGLLSSHLSSLDPSTVVRLDCLVEEHRVRTSFPNIDCRLSLIRGQKGHCNANYWDLFQKLNNLF